MAKLQRCVPVWTCLAQVDAKLDHTGLDRGNINVLGYIRVGRAKEQTLFGKRDSTRAHSARSPHNRRSNRYGVEYLFSSTADNFGVSVGSDDARREYLSPGQWSTIYV